MNPTETTLTELRDAIAAGEISAEAATRAYLDRIDRLDGELGCCNEVFHERSLERARAVDRGEITGPLAGVGVMVKDNMCTSFGRTTCSSKILAGYRSPFDATAVERLEAAGAIILGKTNLDEFAMGSSTENSGTRPTRNPWDTGRVPGGSSGGSAAAVAAGLCAAALGSDTGGSIRQPAALCGVVGLKPTYGLVSRWGLVAFASSLDQIGPITRTVDDTAAVMSVIAGHDPRDSTSATDEFSGGIPDYGAGLGAEGELTIGVAKQYMSDANHPEANRAVERAIDHYRSQGASIVELDLPHTDYGIPAYYIIGTAEASSNLARYDGVHYGYRTEDPADLYDLYAASRAEGFGDEVKRRIMLGTYALSSGYYDAYYLRAQKVRRLIKQEFDAAFEQCDAIVCPTTNAPAFAFGDKTDDPLAMYLNDVYTVNANLAGIPAVSIPAGFAAESDSPRDQRARLPVGLQLIGPAFSEAKLLRAAQQFEAGHKFASERPILET